MFFWVAERVFLMSVLNFNTGHRPIESGTFLGSTKLFICRKFVHGNIYLNIYTNLITAAENGHMTMSTIAKPTPQESKLVHSSIT